MSRMDLATLESRHPADGIYCIDRSMFPKLRMCWGWVKFLETGPLLGRDSSPITLEVLTAGAYQAGRPDSAFIRASLAPWALHWGHHARQLTYDHLPAPRPGCRDHFLRTTARYAMDFLAVRAIAQGHLPEEALPYYPGAREDLESGRRYISSATERLEFRA